MKLVFFFLVSWSSIGIRQPYFDITICHFHVQWVFADWVAVVLMSSAQSALGPAWWPAVPLSQLCLCDYNPSAPPDGAPATAQQILTNIHSYNIWEAGVRCKDSVECGWLWQVHHVAMTADIVLLCVPPRHDRNRDNAGVNCHHTHHLPTPGQGHPPPSAGPSLAKSTRNWLFYLVLSH